MKKLIAIVLLGFLIAFKAPSYRFQLMDQTQIFDTMINGTIHAHNVGEAIPWIKQRGDTIHYIYIIKIKP